eukprot:sb/3477784/
MLRHWKYRILQTCTIPTCSVTQRPQWKNVCSVYDPVLGQPERQLIEEQGLTAPDKGDGCRRKATVPTLFYMIHCSKDMYDNVITSNKGTLSCIFFRKSPLQLCLV